MTWRAHAISKLVRADGDQASQPPMRSSGWGRAR